MKPNGGPAFPQIRPYDEHETGGMSLRDWFAGQALAGVQMNKEIIRAAEESGKTVAELIAGTAYFLADAMLTERAKP